jgi:hypothetical protein
MEETKRTEKKELKKKLGVKKKVKNRSECV